MKFYKTSILLLLLSFILPANYAFANARIHDWVGTYSMNHDGWRGTLIISDSKADCLISAWCRYVLLYKDSNGKLFKGKIKTVNDKGQHMLFYINFPNNKQRFDAYIFSWDKSKIAGITYWGGRKFGFYAVKKY